MDPQTADVKKNQCSGRGAASHSRCDSGFTLVEVIVSALLFTICILGVAVIVRVGTQLQVSDNNRRQARTILRSTFENEYHFRQYNTIPDTTTARVSVVDIDPREGNALKGELTSSVSPGSVTSASGTVVPVKIISLLIKWNEAGALSGDSITNSATMLKMLAAVQ